MELIYLDNNATTRPCDEAIAAMTPLMVELYGNPSSVHRFGQEARRHVDVARSQVARLIECQESEITFTGGGTESISTAVRGILATRGQRKRIVTSTVEHSATRELVRDLAMSGYDVVEVPVDRLGRLDLGKLEAALTDATALVTLIWANNETGVIFPAGKIAGMCRARGIPLHLDGTQAVGKLPVRLATGGPEGTPLADAMSFAGHKIHGPKGVGALYVRRGLRIKPLIVGGTQERGRRGGTENVPGIAGLGAAAEAAGAHLAEMPRMAALRDRLEGGILSAIPETFVNGDREMRIANTTNISFARLEAEAILLLLSEKGICASAGAACSSGSLEPSPVIMAMGIDPKIGHGAVRFSLSRYTTEAEIDRTLEVVPGVIGRLRRVLTA